MGPGGRPCTDFRRPQLLPVAGRASAWLNPRMIAVPDPASLPYRISTLLYVFNVADEALLLHRQQEPNAGLWSPCGGKLQTESGESPFACGCREAAEELGLRITSRDLHLTGMVSECGYVGTAHWLMFLFEVLPRVERLPPPIHEGTFAFVRRDTLETLALPKTDRERIWPWFWQHRGGFFAAHCHCLPEDQYDWTLEASHAP